jgi:hypothetical protein
VSAIALQGVYSWSAGCYAEKEREVEEDADVENNAALLNGKSHETKGKRVTTSLAGLLTALVAGIFGGEPPFPLDVQWHLHGGLTFTISSG